MPTTHIHYKRKVLCADNGKGPFLLFGNEDARFLQGAASLFDLLFIICLQCVEMDAVCQLRQISGVCRRDFFDEIRDFFLVLTLIEAVKSP